MNAPPKRSSVDFTGSGKPPAPNQPTGAFEKAVPAQNKPVEVSTLVPNTSKENFPDIFAQQEAMIQNVKKGGTTKDSEEELVNKLNQSLSGEKKTEEDEDIVKINPEDMKLAEQLIFSGYTESNVEMKNFPGKKFAICSTNAEEMGLIDEIVFEKIRSAKQNDDGTVELPENAIRAMRNSLYIALSYRGVNGVDISNEPTCHINTLKRAILKLGDLFNSGDLENGNKLKEQIKSAMLKRATLVKRMPTPLIDFITDEKFKFDAKMLRIMNEKNVIPLS
jgi:hypothetical protein